MHKLSPTWEGPFTVSRILGNDVYYLIDIRKDDNGEPLTGRSSAPGTSIFSAGFTPNHHVSSIRMSIKISVTPFAFTDRRNRAMHAHISQVAVTS